MNLIETNTTKLVDFDRQFEESAALWHSNDQISSFIGAAHSLDELDTHVLIQSWRDDPQTVVWGILGNGKPVGYIMLQAIKDRNANLHLCIIEDKKKGHCRKAVRQVLNIAFDDFQLLRVSAFVLGNNDRVNRLLTAGVFGFKREGILRLAAIRQGKLVDLNIYGIVKSEFVRR